MAESTVHVVDDDESFLMAMSRLLRASGFPTRTYSSAREFLAERRLDEPGCVVVDLRMPDLGGLDLQAALARTDRGEAGAKLVAVRPLLALLPVA